MRKLFKEVFARQLSDRAPAARRILAIELLDAAAKAADAPVDRFVLLMGARQAAMEAIDLSLSEKAVDVLTGAYNVDGLKLKLDAALKSTGKADTVTATAGNCRVGLRLLDQLVKVDDYSGASRLAGVLQAEATIDPMFSLIVIGRAKDVETLRGLYGRLGKDIDKLKITPTDPAANLAVGSFLCFFKGDWESGLPLLAKGSDPVIKGLAATDLRKSTENEALRQSGDDWWTLGEKQADFPKSRIREHAALQYKQCLGALTGLRKAALEKRIADSTTRLRLVDLLSLSDARTGAVRGDWEMSVAGLKSNGDIAHFELPYAPPPEYMFRIEFTRIEGNHHLSQCLVTPTTSFAFTIAESNEWVGLECVHGKLMRDGPEKLQVPKCLENGRRYVSIVEIRKDRVRGYLDGKLSIDWKTDYSDLSPIFFPEWASRNKALLGLIVLDGVTLFHRAEVLELTGEGKIGN